MSRSWVLRLAEYSLLIAAVLLTLPLHAQGGPVSGDVRLTLSASDKSPGLGAGFAVDLGVDLSAAKTSCTGLQVPISLGAYALALEFDRSRLRFAGAARCPGAHPQLSDPNCHENVDGTGGFVSCTGLSTLDKNRPQGRLCLARLTFTNVAASSATTLSTVHTTARLGISTAHIKEAGPCGGPVTIPAAAIASESVSVAAN